jgi:hypothetical protein
MRKLIVFFLFVATLAFANPFVGRWTTDIGGDPGEKVILVFGETIVNAWQYKAEGIAVANNVGEYTFDERIVVIANTPWLYYASDVNHIGLLGWILQDGVVVPTLVNMVRLGPERKDG